MSIPPIQSSVTPNTVQLVTVTNAQKTAEATARGASSKAAKMGSNKALLDAGSLVHKHPRLAQDSKQLLELKQKRMGARWGRGAKSARKRRLKGRFGRGGIGSMRDLYPFKKLREQLGKTSEVPGSNDYSFLDDPSLSMSEKIEMFLQKIIADSEEKMEELMKKHAQQGKAKNKPGFAESLSKLGSVVAGAVGGPLAAAAVSVASNAVTKGTGATQSSNESDQRMTMFKIQKLQDHVQQMLAFFSTKLKKENDLIMQFIRNMA